MLLTLDWSNFLEYADLDTFRKHLNLHVKYEFNAQSYFQERRLWHSLS